MIADRGGRLRLEKPDSAPATGFDLRTYGAPIASTGSPTNTSHNRPLVAVPGASPRAIVIAMGTPGGATESTASRRASGLGRSAARRQGKINDRSAQRRAAGLASALPIPAVETG